MDTEERALRDLHAAWIDAVNGADLGRLLGLMTDDVVLLGPGQDPTGRDGFSARFTGAHQQFLIHCQSDLQNVVIVGEIAYTRCQDALSVQSRAGGEATRFAGHRLTIYRRQPDARWLLACDAHTLSPVTI